MLKTISNFFSLKKNTSNEEEYLDEPFTIVTLLISVKSSNNYAQPVCDISFDNSCDDNILNSFLSRRYSFYNCHVWSTKSTLEPLQFRFSFPYYNKEIRGEKELCFFPTIEVYDHGDVANRISIRDVIDLNIANHDIENFNIKISEDNTLVKPLFINTQDTRSISSEDVLGNKVIDLQRA
jgi:hypothetical protein